MRCTRTTPVCLAAAALLLVSCGGGGTPPGANVGLKAGYRFVDLGSGALPHHINDAGEVVGEVDKMSAAFAYVDGKLHLLDGLTSSDHRAALSVNNEGTIVGKTVNGGVSQAVEFHLSGSATSLGGPGGSAGNEADAIDDTGAIYGSNGDGCGGSEMISLDGHGGGSDLGIAAFPVAINSAGNVLFSQFTAATSCSFGFSSPMLYPADVQIPTPPDVCWSKECGGVTPAGMNDNGDVVGYYRVENQTTGMLQGIAAFYYHAGKSQELLPPGGMVDLTTDISANAVNDLGVIVGGYSTPSHSAMFVWQNGAMRDLDSLVSIPAGFQMQGITGMNNGGSIIGVGLYKGVEHGFVLVKQRA